MPDGCSGKFTFRIVLDNNVEVRRSFFADTEDEARTKAEDWADGGIVYECTERWGVTA